jgi:hypothetical protein
MSGELFTIQTDGREQGNGLGENLLEPRSVWIAMGLAQ